MKILRITLCNIASLAGTQTVDFTREPLHSAGLLSISGPTGSGKSTLLDALCLALYEKTPRLGAASSTTKLTTSVESISQKDPGNLLRRGTASGFAEVAFVGVDQAIYTARWSIRRAHNRADGTLRGGDMVLFRGNIPPGGDGPKEQSGRKTEVLPAIATKVGLSFEQFTRAVLLAQNEFAAFLKADDRERAEILQALTGTERFEAISRRVYERCGEKVRAADDAAQRLAGSAPLDAEARARVEIACTEAVSAYEVAAAKTHIRQQHANWFEQHAGLVRDAAASEEKLRDAREKYDLAAPRRLELDHTVEISREARSLRDAEKLAGCEAAEAIRNCTNAEKTDAESRLALTTKKLAHDRAKETVREANNACVLAEPQLRRARELDALLPPLARRLADASHERGEAEAFLAEREKQHTELRSDSDKAQQELTAVAAKRDTLAAFAPFAPEAGMWLGRLDHVQQARESLKTAETELKNAKKGESEKNLVVTEKRDKAITLRTNAQNAANELEKAELAAKTYDGEKIAADRKSATEATVALDYLRTHSQDVAARAKEAAALTDELTQLRQDQAKEEVTLNELTGRQIPEATTALESARRSFELAEAAVTNATVALREKLSAGEACPVCGATEHPYSQHPPSVEGAALRALKADISLRENRLADLRHTVSLLGAQREARASRIAEKASTLEERSQQLARLREVRHQHPAAVTIIDLPESERESAIEKQITLERAKIKAAEESELSRRNAEKQRDQCRVARDKAIASLAALEKELANLEAGLAAAQSAAKAAEAQRRKEEGGFAAAILLVETLFPTIAGGLENWQRDPEAFRASFQSGTSEFSSLGQESIKLSQAIEKMAAAQGPVEESRRRAAADLQAKKTAEATVRTEQENLQTQRLAIFNGKASDEVETTLREASKRSVEKFDVATGELVEAEKRIATAAEALRSAQKLQEEKARRQSTETAALDLWLTAFVQRSSRALDRATLDLVLARNDAWFRAEQAALESFERDVRTAEGARGVHQKALEDHLAKRPTNDNEATVTADLAGLRESLAAAEKNRNETQATLLADNQRRSTSSKLAEEVEALRLAARPWQQLSELIGSSDGAKFRSIAQRRTLDILLGYANSHLEQLAPRYHVDRIPESLNLLVVDREMSDERRSVHSLSGGESFLISLGLALGLASLTSNRLRIESLFIDEGFGSLDSETLNTAMTALMHLEAQGRKVGIISHVPELADAIPVQIRVVKGRGGASYLVVPGGEPASDADAKSLLLETEAHQPPPAAIEAIAEQILSILRREDIASKPLVSSRALRNEIGCTLAEFTAAREQLGRRISAEGKSLKLVKMEIPSAPPPSGALQQGMLL